MTPQGKTRGEALLCSGIPPPSSLPLASWHSVYFFPDILFFFLEGGEVIRFIYLFHLSIFCNGGTEDRTQDLVPAVHAKHVLYR